LEFFPTKDRTGACADASVGIEFNRPPVIKSGKKIVISEVAGGVFDSVTSSLNETAGYFSQLTARTTGGKTYQSDVLYVVNNTVVFHPKGNLQFGKTYSVTVEEGLITDSLGTAFSVPSGWTFTVRSQAPAKSDAYTLAADGSGDYCSVEGVLQALPDGGSSTRVVTVKHGVYPGIVQMTQSKVHFKGAGIDSAVFASKNSTPMNGAREGFVLSGSDVTFENMMIYNTFPHDSSGRQAEALIVNTGSQRVFLNNVHLRSHQDTLRVEGASTYMKGGIISGSTDPLWGSGGFFCDGCELRSRTDGHSFVVVRSDKGFGMVNCKLTRESDALVKTYLAQYHDNRPKGKVAYANCKFDEHIVGWNRIADTWWEYNNTRLKSGAAVKFEGKQLSAGSPEVDSLSSVQKWLGWTP
jgi:pectin methylesterase-like acyl-CoA thioesterase